MCVICAAECEACLRSCLEANNLRAKELLEDDDLAVVRNEEWFPRLLADVKVREEEQRKITQEEKRKKRKASEDWELTSDDDDDNVGDEEEGAEPQWSHML
jgi:hypothetical protein